jgi:hypothetical protein
MSSGVRSALSVSSDPLPEPSGPLQAAGRTVERMDDLAALAITAACFAVAFALLHLLDRV